MSLRRKFEKLSNKYTVRPSEVIYQIYPASFNDGDGDGFGDIKGIIEKLDYLKYLDVDALWLSPIYPSPEGPEGDGGYAVNDRRDVGKKFGSLDDMQNLIDEAHSRGLRVYMDDVLPHTSDQHEWFKKSVNREEPFEDYFIWADAKEDENGNKTPS
jgi:glycosidase